MRRTSSLLVLTLALFPQAAALGDEPFQPSAVVASWTSDGDVIVSWTPGEEFADFYTVYGINPDGAVPLVRIEGLTPYGEALVTVPEEYESYGVSGTKLGVESEILDQIPPILDEIPDLLDRIPSGPPCLRVDPPNVTVGCRVGNTTINVHVST